VIAIGLILFVLGGTLHHIRSEPAWSLPNWPTPKEAVIYGVMVLLGLLLMLAGAAKWLWMVAP
jgi:hypothetical protein